MGRGALWRSRHRDARLLTGGTICLAGQGREPRSGGQASAQGKGVGKRMQGRKELGLPRVLTGRELSKGGLGFWESCEDSGKGKEGSVRRTQAKGGGLVGTQRFS